MFVTMTTLLIRIETKTRKQDSAVFSIYKGDHVGAAFFFNSFFSYIFFFMTGTFPVQHVILFISLVIVYH